MSQKEKVDTNEKNNPQKTQWEEFLHQLEEAHQIVSKWPIERQGIIFGTITKKPTKE